MASTSPYSLPSGSIASSPANRDPTPNPLPASPAAPPDNTAAAPASDRRRLPWDEDNNMMRYGLVYILETKYPISPALSAAERRALVPRVFTMAFLDKVQNAGLDDEVNWYLLSQMNYERTGKRPAKAWKAVQDPNQTVEQLAAAAEARERVDVADVIIKNGDGQTMNGNPNPYADAAITRHVNRVIPRQNIETGDKINTMNMDHIIAVLETMFPDAPAGDISAFVILSDGYPFTTLYDGYAQLSKTFQPRFGLMEIFTSVYSPFRGQ